MGSVLFKKADTREARYKTVGGIVGGVGVAPKTVYNSGRAVLGMDYNQRAVNFSNMLKASLGVAGGRMVGKGVEHATRRKYDQNRRNSRNRRQNRHQPVRRQRGV